MIVFVLLCVSCVCDTLCVVVAKSLSEKNPKNKRIGQGLEVRKLYFIIVRTWYWYTSISGQINVDLYVPAHKGGNRDHTTTYIKFLSVEDCAVRVLVLGITYRILFSQIPYVSSSCIIISSTGSLLLITKLMKLVHVAKHM